MENTTQPSEQNEPAVVKYRDPKEVLTAARKLIQKEENWASNLSLVGGKRLCALFALDSVSKVREGVAYAALRKAMGNKAIGEFNDRNSHAKVLAAFDKAIEQCAVGDRESDATRTEVA